MATRKTVRTDPATATGGTIRLRILATSDLHGHLLPFDYYADRPAAAMGIACVATVVRRLRSAARGAACLLLDNGDTFTGTPLADWWMGGCGERRPRGPDPVAAALASLRPDAATLGNHDLDFGLDPLLRRIGALPYPIVCANLRLPHEPARWGPWAVLERQACDRGGVMHPLRIGITGFAPPQTVPWNGVVLGGRLVAEGIVTAARREIPDLVAAGADVVIALCHAGPHDREAPEGERTAELLARVGGIDALILGHTHEVFPAGRQPGRIGAVAAVQPGCHGSHVGVIDLLLARRDGSWRTVASRARAVPTAGAIPDPDLAGMAAPAHRRVRALLRRPLAPLESPLSNAFALVAPDRTLALVAAAQTAAARQLLGDRPEARLPLVAAAAPFRLAGGGGSLALSPGPLRLRDALALHPHPDRLVVLEITGADLRGWLERSAAVFATLRRGKTDQPLLAGDVPGYGFDVLSGLEWVVDPSRPPGRRIAALQHAGRPVAAADRFVLAASSFRLGGGGGFGAGWTGRPLAVSARTIREIVVGWLAGGGSVPGSGIAWRFASLPGTAAWIDLRPDADPAAAPGCRIEALDLQPSGLRRFRLWLGDPSTGDMGQATSRAVPEETRCPAPLPPSCSISTEP
ncbi:bifunctional UDP-sugar hydrolase/5'-nucleotidase [Rubellimicrobium sp. CFH 75288]|uniref:bifunctional metallophosphatase/5'-nucleotidase n=1 Tax=Rubellimicrobium sp. CFH 75288 TaxID=2697034 RepID=UPI0014131ADB|nr:5'-nucleotidase C-terminal domain-containing protein [Rubellimicrobium sp. CFH 75288]NAZ35642.1 2',3'-cyclic-nucleotide 2'-phosphodiesterase [Rubellimicrobium sp. CFH 75288]